jgi:hypothetical protein
MGATQARGEYLWISSGEKKPAEAGIERAVSIRPYCDG